MLPLIFLATGLQSPLPPSQRLLIMRALPCLPLHALHMDEGRKESPDEERPSRQQTDERDIGDKLNELLDRPFFDPAENGKNKIIQPLRLFVDPSSLGEPFG